LLAAQSTLDLENITLLLGVSEIPSEDLSFYTERWKPGTCEWISYNPAFSEWLEDSTESGILWIHALPGSGKSILASYIVTLLLGLYRPCGYFFYRFDDHSKKSLAACLRSLAFQTAQQLPEFRSALNSLSNIGLKLEKADARTIWKTVFQGILFKSSLSTGLYWVIDGLDESDSPKLLIELLSSLTSSQLPIKILLVSRRSPEIALAIERIAMTTLIRVMPMEDNQLDIEVFVKQEIELIHATPELKVDIVRRLLDKADGNFLWVRLALDELLQCHTQEDIEEALEGIPAGMEELYLRMEDSVTKSSRASHKALATSIFSWAVCGRRPLTIEELSQALLPEFPIVRDLKDTVSQMCGQFVVVDVKSSQVKMVHQTAKNFLLSISNSSLSIQPLVAHEQLFSKCVKFLSDPQLRRRPGQVDERAFARYAAVSWAYHLDASSPASENVLNLLTDFFKGQAVLVWISVLASIGDLEKLVQTSRSLTIFIQRRRKHDAGINPLLHKLGEIEGLELWATDLNKICAKFSQNLIGDPSTIFKLVPPFCARDSMIYKQFASKDLTTSTLRVSGITDTGWDDNLGKINVNPGHRAKLIICFGSNFAVSTSNGNIVLYNAITFEKICTFEHGEKVHAMSWSNSGTRFVSHGLRTTKIWLMSTLQLEFTVPCLPKSRALGITFSSDDSKIIIGCMDRNIRFLALDDIQAGWSLIDARLLREEVAERGNSSSPNTLKFNPDATYVAVAYRSSPLSAWSIESSEMIGRCMRNTETNEWSPVSDVVWHPTSGEVLGRYHDGAVFKWHPYDQTHQEVFADAITIACSPEGSLFAITDAAGRIKLYNFHHFTIIYQLSYQGSSSQITFSPDSRRIYDLRGQVCNAWEPNALIRLNDTEERESEIGSEIESTPAASMVSDTHSKARDRITAVAVCPGTRYYAVGNDAGLVQIFEHGKFISELWKCKSVFMEGMLMAVHVDWAEDGKHVGIFELGGRVFIQKGERPSKPNTAWSFQEHLSVEVGVGVGGVQQILLNHTSTQFLVAYQTSINVWSCHTGKMVTSRIFEAKESPLRWMNHPTDSNLLMAFSLSHITVYKWYEMAMVATLDFAITPLTKIVSQNDQEQNESKQEVPTSSVISTTTRIQRLFLSPTKAHIIVQYSQSLSTTGTHHQTLIFDKKSLSDITQTKVAPIPIPDRISNQVEVPLTVLSKNLFVFLDKQHWMCSFRIDANKSPKRHFFLPRDWLNTDSLALCTMLSDGTFLCPKNGEVAAVKSAVGAEW
jgi:WD40 repeat protein